MAEFIDTPQYFVPAEPGTFALVTSYDADGGFRYWRERVIAWGITDDWTWSYTLGGKAGDGYDVAVLFPDGKVESVLSAWNSLEEWALSAAGDALDHWKALHCEGLAQQERETRQRRAARAAAGGGTGAGFAALSALLDRPPDDG